MSNSSKSVLSFLRSRITYLLSCLVCGIISFSANAADEVPPAPEVRVDDAGRVWLSRAGKPFAVMLIRKLSDAGIPQIVAPEPPAQAEKADGSIKGGAERVSNLKFDSLQIIQRVKRISTGARVSIINDTDSRTETSNPAPIPKLEMAVQIFAAADGKAPEMLYIDNERIAPEPMMTRRARTWSFEDKKNFRVSLARSAPVEWNVERSDSGILMRSRIVPDPRRADQPGSFIFYIGTGPDEAPPEIGLLKIDKHETPARDFIEGSVRVYASGANPFVLTETAVVAEIACPPRADGEVPIKRLPCFFWEAPSSFPAEGEFRFRFAPPVEGLYGVRIAVVTGTGQVRTDALPFRANPPASSGSVRTRPNDRNFWLEDGSLFIPLGGIIRPKSDSEVNADAIRKVFIELARQGGNAAVLDLTAPGLNLEHENAGRYDANAAAALDEILLAAQVRGIRLILQIESAQNIKELSDKHPYFREKGGPLAATPEYFRNIQSKKLLQNRLTYLAARFGAFRSVFAWDVLANVDNAWPILKRNPDDPLLKAGEADLCRRARRDVQEWAEETALHIKGMDQHGHLACISTTISPESPWVDLERVEHLDFLLGSGLFPAGAQFPDPAYTDDAAVIQRWAAAAREPGRAHKPHVLMSFGIDQLSLPGNAAPDSELLRRVLDVQRHNQVFASLACGMAGAPFDSGGLIRNADDATAAEFSGALVFAGALRQLMRVQNNEETRSISLSFDSAEKRHLRAFGRSNPNGMVVWLQDKASSWSAAWTKSESLGENKNVTVRLPGINEADYVLGWMDPWSGKVLAAGPYHPPGQQVGKGQEPTVLQVPQFRRDIALIILRRDIVGH